MSKPSPVSQTIDATAIATSSMEETPRPSLMGIPYEVRAMIYGYIFHNKTIHFRNPSGLSDYGGIRPEDLGIDEPRSVWWEKSDSAKRAQHVLRLKKSTVISLLEVSKAVREDASPKFWKLVTFEIDLKDPQLRYPFGLINKAQNITGDVRLLALIGVIEWDEVSMRRIETEDDDLLSGESSIRQPDVTELERMRKEMKYKHINITGLAFMLNLPYVEEPFDMENDSIHRALWRPGSSILKSRNCTLDIDVKVWSFNPSRPDASVQIHIREDQTYWLESTPPPVLNDAWFAELERVLEIRRVPAPDSSITEN